MASLPDTPLKLKAQPREVTPVEALKIEDLFDGPLYEWGFCVWTDENKDALLLWEQTTDLESVPCDLLGGVTWHRLCLEWRLADPAYEQQCALYVIGCLFAPPEHRVLRYTY